MRSDLILKSINGGGGSGTIDCPYKLTVFTGTVDDPVPPGTVAYKLGPGLVNTVLITEGTTQEAGGDGGLYFINIGDTDQMIFLTIDVTDVAVQGGVVSYGIIGDPPSPQEDFPEGTVYVPLYVFDVDGSALRVIGCNNVCLSSYVAYTMDNDESTGITDYPFTNFWSWAVYT